jgi:hypothetical protein
MTAPAVVITPTTGLPFLAKAMESTNTQPCEHWIVIDGAEHAQKVADILQAGDYVNKKIILLPENTGKPHQHWSRKDGVKFFGNRIYAGISNLVNAEHVLFLDEDNWFDPNHVETMLHMLNATGRDHEWCYSLRKCVDQHDNYLFNDDCDSLGIFASWKNINLVDMNCYCFKTEFLMKINSTLQTDYYWTDRLLSRVAVSTAKDYYSYGCTGLYTVNYRVRPEAETFFKEGNEFMNKLYNGNFPWRAKC